jgi:hypothetical protein
MVNKKTDAMVLWDKKLAEEAKSAVDVVAGLGGGQFFSIRGGTLKLGDAALPNNEVVGIILDHVLENVFYGVDYDPENPSSPTCYAFGRDANTMTPHDDSEKKVCDLCKSCENNQFGSATKGRGKACKNRVRLAIIPGGQVVGGRFEPITDPDDIKAAQMAFMGVPPTSLGSFGAYVKSVASGLKRPPWAVFTRIRLVPDAKTQVALTFELLGPCSPALAEALTAKKDEAQACIIFPYQKQEAAAPKKRGRRPRGF